MIIRPEVAKRELDIKATPFWKNYVANGFVFIVLDVAAVVLSLRFQEIGGGNIGTSGGRVGRIIGARGLG